MLLAAGTAVFKPGVQGTLAATLKDSNASVGWAIFYQMVNVGGGVGPILAGVLRIMDWQYVFLSCAVIVSINFLWLPFYKDPSQDAGGVSHTDQAATFASLSKSVSRPLAFLWLVLWGVGALIADAVYLGEIINSGDFNNWYLAGGTSLFALTFVVFLALKERLDAGRTDALSVLIVSVIGLFQPRVFWFCISFSGFWVMFNQVFDLLPNVIDDWMDTSGIITTLGTAFSTPIAPSVLAAFLALVYAVVVAAAVLIAMRPDHRPAKEVPAPPYHVVALSLIAAWVYPALLGAPTQLMMAAAIATALGVLSTALVAVTRAPANAIASCGAAITALSGFFWMRTYFMGQSSALIEMADEGAQVPPEWMINLNALLIVFTMVFFGYLTSYVRPLTSIILGMIIATAGSIIAGTAVVGWICLAGVAVFSVGEMLSSPKKMEYLATLSKKGQEGLFMGYANVPGAIGWITGSIIAGSAYEEHGDKVNLAKKYLRDELNVPQDTIDNLQKTEVVPLLSDKLDMTAMQVQSLLFDFYSPEFIWLQIGAIGAVSIVGMVLYDRTLRFLDSRKAA